MVLGIPVPGNCSLFSWLEPESEKFSTEKVPEPV